MRRKHQKGQALLLVVLALGLLLIGAVGLAIDGSQFYAHRQMAQAAADAAAQAGIVSIFNGTNTGTNSYGTGSPPSSFTCTTTDVRTPCVYARNNGFGGNAADTVTVSFPASISGVSGLSTDDPVNLIQVSVQRSVTTGLIRFLGPSSATVKAIAAAAIVKKFSPVPIIVTHPTLASSLKINGSGGGKACDGTATSNLITICGGPKRSIQVNSKNAGAFVAPGNGLLDLSQAGPGGNGADFGNAGGPLTPLSNLHFGSVGKYIQPALVIKDPLETIPQPAVPTTAGLKTTITASAPAPRYGCPSGEICTLFKPGVFSSSSGITVAKADGRTLFAPGLYYISQGGFNVGSGTFVQMATGFPADAATGSGMVVFNTGNGNKDVFKFDANAGSGVDPTTGSAGGITLVGADAASIYKGILFFEDRNSADHSGGQAHSIQGSGAISLTGTIYLTNTENLMTASRFQELQVQGSAGSSTTIIGEIIVGALTVGGNGAVKMTLSSASTLLVRQVALVK